MLTGYGPTAARKHGRPGRDTRPCTTTIDIHSHVSVPAAAAIVEPYLDLSTIPLAFFSTPETKAVNAQQDAARRSRMSARGDGVTDRLRDLDEMGIDLQDAAAAAMLLHGANRHQRKSDANRK